MDHSHPSKKRLVEDWVDSSCELGSAKLRRSLTNWHDNPIQSKSSGPQVYLKRSMLGCFQDSNRMRNKWMFPKIGVPQNGWFIIYNGKPYQNGWFGGTTIFGNIHLELILEHPSSPKAVGLGIWIESNFSEKITIFQYSCHQRNEKNIHIHCSKLVFLDLPTWDHPFQGSKWVTLQGPPQLKNSAPLRK